MDKPEMLYQNDETHYSYFASHYQQIYFGEALSLCDQIRRRGTECRMAKVEDVLELTGNADFQDFINGKNKN